MTFPANNSNQLSLLKALASSSKVLLENSTPGNSIDEVLSIIGNATGVSRTYIFKNIFENGKLNKVQYEYEWCNSGVIPQIAFENVNLVEWSQFEEIKDELSNGGILEGTIKNLENENLKQLLTELGVVSILFIPIFSNYVFWGFIGFDDCKNEREWNEGEIITLSATAANIGLYVYKHDLNAILLKKNNQIEEQKIFFENIFDNIPVDIGVFSPENKYLLVNKSAIKNDEIRKWIIGKDDFEYVAYRNKPIEIAIERRKIFEQVKNNKKSFSLEESLGDGEALRHYLRFKQPVLNNLNEVAFMIGCGIDVTELKQKEELIIKQQQAIEKSPIGIALLNSKGEFYYMNKAHADMYEYTPNELYGKHWKTIYEQKEFEKIEYIYLPLLKSNGTWAGECEGITKNRSIISKNISLTTTDDGGIICISRDVTKTKIELKKVQKINQQLELAMKASNLGRWTYNVENGDLELNPTIGEILGLSEAELKTFNYIGFIKLIHEEDRKLALNAIKEHAKIFETNKNHIYQAEYRIKKNDGRYIWIMSFGKILKYIDGNIPTEITGFIIDIDEQKRNDEQIKQSDKRYKELVENLNEIVFTSDINGNLNYLNSAWTEVTGFSVEETVKNRLIYYLHPDDKETINKLKEDFLSLKLTSFRGKIRFLDVNNKILYLEFKANCHKDKNGKFLAIVGTIENVTPRIEAEKALEANKEILNKVINSINDVIWSHDVMAKNLSFISPSIFKLIGINANDFYNGTQIWYDFVHPDDLEMLKKSDFQLQNNLIKERDINYRLSFGNPSVVKHIRSQAKLVLNDINEPIRIDGVLSDISELIMAKERLKESESKYRLISENIKDIITIFDNKGRIHYISPSATKITGIPQDDCETKSFFELTHPDDRKLIKHFLYGFVSGEKEGKLTFRALFLDGTYHWIESIVSLIEKKGKTVLLQTSNRDITERIQAQLELTKAIQKEKELRELKSRFVNIASHEFRTPLATIKSSSELIKLFIDKDENKLTPVVYDKVNKKIETILTDVNNITDLISDILTMGKVEANKIGFNPEPINFSEFITEYIETDAVKIFKNRVLDYNIPSNNYVTNVDTKLMRQVFQNVIENAIKYSANYKAVELTLMANEKSSIFKIKDNGIGIPASDLQYLYQSFFRASNAENIPGTGLGMSIVKLFVEMHGGTVSIESTLNVGTTISIEIPNVKTSNIII